MTATALLYDGQCRFCAKGARAVQRLARRGDVVLVDFQQPGVLARYPALSHAACMAAIHLVTSDGTVFRGMEAVVRALLTRGWLCVWAWLYYTPGLRQLADLGYDAVARNRYRLFGRREACSDEGCAVHFATANQREETRGGRRSEGRAGAPQG